MKLESTGYEITQGFPRTSVIKDSAGFSFAGFYITHTVTATSKALNKLLVIQITEFRNAGQVLSKK